MREIEGKEIENGSEGARMNRKNRKNETSNAMCRIEKKRKVLEFRDDSSVRGHRFIRRDSVVTTFYVSFSELRSNDITAHAIQSIQLENESSRDTKVERWCSHVRMTGDELTKHLSFLRSREGGIGRLVGPCPLEVNRQTHIGTIGQFGQSTYTFLVNSILRLERRKQITCTILRWRTE